MSDLPTTLPNPVRVAIYARVSTKDKGQDVENQARQLRDFCAVQGWTIVSEAFDQASAKSNSRPAFRQLFEDARRRKFDIVLFWSLDRFSREGALATLKYLEQLTEAGVNWRSYTEQYLDSCGIFRDAVLAILAVIAKQERVRISERVTAGMQRAKAEGKSLGRRKKVFDRATVLELRADGKSYTEIGSLLGISKSLVHLAVKGDR
jgi:DNA invertase Pin-like site-specific DNA recombinase